MHGHNNGSPRSRRVRRKVGAMGETALTRDEQAMIQQAIENSKLDTSTTTDQIGEIQVGPIFHPTVAEFADPLAYIAKIRAEAEQYGICKIVPPEGWNPPCMVDMNSSKRFETKRQIVNRLQEGITFEDGAKYDPHTYQMYASEQTKKWQKEHYPDGGMTLEALERDYWGIVETGGSGKVNFTAEYGNDIDCTNYWSGFPTSNRGRSMNGQDLESEKKKPEPEFGTPQYYEESWWNLNNISNTPGSVLRHIKVPINGVNVPWLYMGTLFSTFCWHNEDNYLYSINYHHKGAPKQWYGVPGTKKDADGLEKVFKNFLMQRMREAPDLLHHITTMFSPILLSKANIPVCKLAQFPGEFIVTFPRAFHGGFSYGPNIGEAVNFATPDWIAHGAAANERYRIFGRPSVFSHDRLTFTICQYLDEHSIESCDLLMQELSRVIQEEEMLRDRLEQNGIRNVTSQVTLPKNRVDKLDDVSADYDDKRLCHTCKHICFFSAIACRCNQSRVSCLRHSNWLCSCHNSQKFLLTWATTKEMRGVLDTVSQHHKQMCAEVPKEEEEEEEGWGGGGVEEDEQDEELDVEDLIRPIDPPEFREAKEAKDVKEEGEGSGGGQEAAAEKRKRDNLKAEGDWGEGEQLSLAQQNYVERVKNYVVSVEPAARREEVQGTLGPWPGAHGAHGAQGAQGGGIQDTIDLTLDDDEKSGGGVLGGLGANGVSSSYDALGPTSKI
ncbi:hypothetical protein TrST_g10127 [Triparma strigata]|uniref:Uncharacterized protein n=1 Tax=Triparma strigata TaxID=1606541 RepID=A0A9W7A781_9STRA|nr:hypothetical protein TrST_g10127 [Triparma strigata]